MSSSLTMWLSVAFGGAIGAAATMLASVALCVGALFLGLVVGRTLWA